MKALIIIGQMDLLQCPREGGKSFGGADILGKGILQPHGGNRKNLGDVGRNYFLTQPLGKRIDRKQRRKRTAFGVRLKGRGGHGAFVARSLHLAIETEGGTQREGRPKKFLIKIGDFAYAAVIKCTELQERHTSLDAADLAFRGYGQDHRTLFPGLHVGQKTDVPAVFISARKEVEQVKERVHACGGVRLCLNSTDAVQRGHGYFV